MFEIPTQLVNFSTVTRNACLMETSLKVAKFMESPHRPPLPRAALHPPSLSVFPQNTKDVVCKTKRARSQVASLSREESSGSLYLNRVRVEVFPLGAVWWRINQSQLNFHSLQPEEKLDSHKWGSAGVRNMRSAWLFIFWALSNTSRWESTEVFACEVLKLISVSCFH